MASNPTSSLAPQLEAATRKYQDLQEELSKAVSSREKLGAQQVETESVKKVMQCLMEYFIFRISFEHQEFATLKATNIVYKLIGPVLVPQDQEEAKSNVEKRLEFISTEL
jgi:prefoldin beta subunit